MLNYMEINILCMGQPHMPLEVFNKLWSLATPVVPLPDTDFVQDLRRFAMCMNNQVVMAVTKEMLV